MNRLPTIKNRILKPIDTVLHAGAYLLLLLPALYLYSCGGGNDVAGIDGSGAPLTSTSGTVNGFGSVIVNGVRYHSDKAQILVDGEKADENSLRAGYQVRVTGTLNKDGTGNAKSIEFSPTLIGAITSIDSQAEQIVLLQQRIQITSGTLFDTAIEPNNLSGLTPGTYILVSGQRNSEGFIAATRIELAPQSTEQLFGVIDNVDLNNRSFTLNNLTVNYQAATIKHDTDNGTNGGPTINIAGPVANGQTVSITGSLDSDGIFQATNISVKNISFSAKVKAADIEGFVTLFASSANFYLAGVPCSSDSATVYINGSSSTLALGSSLKIKGSVNADGVLLAQQIEFRQQVRNEIAGEVSSVSTALSGAIATGSFVIAGTSIQTNNSTAYEDGGHDQLKRFNFADIRQGNFLKVSGYTSQNIFIASKIERRNFTPQNELRYQGIVTQTADHSFTVYNQTIAINGASEIRGTTGANLTEEEFLAQALNQYVRVRGTIINGLFTASQVELRQQNQSDFYHPNDGGGDQGGGGPQNGGHEEDGPQEGDHQEDGRQNDDHEGGDRQDGGPQTSR